MTERPAATAATMKTTRTIRPRRARMLFTLLLLLHLPRQDPSCSLPVPPPPLPRRSTHARRSSTGQRQSGGSQFRVLDLLEQGPGRRAAEADLVLADRGQRRVDQRRRAGCRRTRRRRGRRDRRGRLRAPPSSRRRPSGRRREDGGWRLRQLEQRPHCLLAALGVPVADLLVPGGASPPRACSSARKPTNRSSPGLWFCGPAMVAIRRCPSLCRCRTARRAPPTLSDATLVAWRRPRRDRRR